MRVYLTRHADAGEFFHAPGMKDPDPSLSILGREQTSRLADHMKDEPDEYDPTVVYTSMLSRARQTGKILAQKLGLGPVIQESGFGPVDHRGPTLGVVLKRLAAQKDPKVKRILVVSHHDSIRQGLAVMNDVMPTEVDPIAKSELRIIDMDREDGTWKEIHRCMPSDLDDEAPDLY